MANILTHLANGAIYFDNGTAGSSSVPALTGSAASLNYDGGAGLNITSYNTTSTDRFSVDGAGGRLFSVNDSLTGTIFSVNDAAGLPIIEVESTSSTDTITMGTYASNALVVAGDRVGIGTASPGSSYKLDVTGDVNINGDIVLGGKLDFSGNITAATSDTDVFVVIDAGELKTRTGAQVASDIGLGNVTNESKATMFSSPSFTGTPIAPTASANTNTTQIATTAYVQTEIGELIGGAPAALDTLNELAAAIGDDASYASSITTALAAKAPLASPNFTGDVDVAGSITTEGPDGGMVMRTWTGGGSYGMIGTANMSGGEYSLLTDGTSTYLSGGTGGNVYIRGGNNDSNPQITVSNGNIGLAGVPSKSSEATAIVWDGTNIGYRELGSAAFSATSAFAPATGSTSIVSLGTVVTGDWNAGVISSTYLDADTAHLSGTQTFSGAKTFSSGLNISVSTSNTQLKLKRTGTATGEFNIYTNNDTLFFNNVGQSSFPMVIDEDGNVGIGTTAPQEKLELGSGGKIGLKDAAGTYDSVIYNDGTTFKVADGAGSYHVDKINLLGLLDLTVGHTIKGIDNSIIANKDILAPKDGSFGFRTYGSTSQYDAISSQFIDNNNNALSFNTKSGGTTSEAVRIDKDGNVGIGTTTPQRKLEVYDTESAIRLSSSYGYSSSLQQGGGVFHLKAHHSFGLAINYGEGNAGLLQLYNNTTAAVRFAANGSSYFNGGNVGIGTTAPNHKLDIYSNENVPLRIHRPSNANLDSSGAWGIGFSTRGDAVTSTTDTRAGIFSYYNGNLFLAANSTSIVSDPDAYARLTVAAAGNVGIGDTTPSYKLDVAGDIRATGDLRADDDVFIAGDVLRFTNDAASAYIQSADALILEADYDADDTGGKPITFKTAGTTKMTIAGGGDVTINNGLIVSGDLTVNGTTSTINSTTLQVDDKNIELGTVATPTDTTADGGGITLKGATDKTINWINSTDAWTFSERIAIPYGNQSAPSLTFSSSTNTGIYGASTFLRLVVGGVWKASIASNGVTSNGFIKEGGSSAEFLKADGSVDSTSYLPLAGGTIDGSLIIDTDTGSQPFYVTRSGNPNESLKIYISDENAVFESIQDETADNYGGFIFNMDAGTTHPFFDVRKNNSTIMRVDGGGNVGIGTTSPASLLHISSSTSGDAVLTIEADTDNNDENDNPYIHFKQDGGGVTAKAGIEGTNGLTFTNSLGNHAYLGSEQNHGVQLYANGAAGLTLRGGGDIGIGTNAPETKLHVYKSSATSGTSTGTSVLRLQNYVGSDLSQQKVFADFVLADDNANEIPQVRIGAEVGQNGDADSQVKEGSGAFVVYTNNADTVSGDAGASLAERMRVDYQGNVGIGTTSPAAKLHAYNSAGGNASDKAGMLSEAVMKLQPHASNSTNMLFAQVNSGNGIGIQVTNGAATANWDIALSPFGGNVGIGTASPSYKLDVNGDFRVVNASTFSAATYFDQYLYHAGDTDTFIRFQTNDVNLTAAGQNMLRVDGNSTQKTVVVNEVGIDADFRVEASGVADAFFVRGSDARVGIGTTSPDAQLASEGSQTIGWSDLSNSLILAGTATNGIGLDSNEIAKKGGELYIGTTDSGDDVVFRAGGGATRLTIDGSNGNITIANNATVSGDLTVDGEVEFTGLNSASASPFVVSDGGTLGTRTAAQVLSDIGGQASISAPNAPASASAAIVGETVEVTFTASTTSNIDAYLVYSSIDGSDYGLISVVPPDDFAASMSIIDNAFDETGTQAYRVYAMKYGILSSATTASVSYTVSSAEPTTMSVINLNNAYYVQWNPPSSNARFVTAYNVYKHEHATQGSLSRSSASLIYSGMNTNYMYQISGTNNNNFHQFWVETTIA